MVNIRAFPFILGSFFFFVFSPIDGIVYISCFYTWTTMSDKTSGLFIFSLKKPAKYSSVADLSQNEQRQGSRLPPLWQRLSSHSPHAGWREREKRPCGGTTRPTGDQTPRPWPGAEPATLGVRGRPKPLSRWARPFLTLSLLASEVTVGTL